MSVKVRREVSLYLPVQAQIDNKAHHLSYSPCSFAFSVSKTYSILINDPNVPMRIGYRSICYSHLPGLMVLDNLVYSIIRNPQRSPMTPSSPTSAEFIHVASLADKLPNTLRGYSSLHTYYAPPSTFYLLLYTRARYLGCLHRTQVPRRSIRPTYTKGVTALFFTSLLCKISRPKAR